MAQHDAGGAGAGKPDRGNEVAVTDGERISTGQPCISRPGRERDRKHRGTDSRLQCGNERQRKNQPGESQEHVGQPHKDAVQHAPGIAGDAADDQPDRGDQQRNGDDHAERDPPAIDDARIKVASQFVGTEPVCPGRGGEPVGEVLSGWIVRGNQRRGDRGDDQYDGCDQPRHREMVAPQQQP